MTRQGKQTLLGPWLRRKSLRASKIKRKWTACLTRYLHVNASSQALSPTAQRHVLALTPHGKKRKRVQLSKWAQWTLLPIPISRSWTNWLKSRLQSALRESPRRKALLGRRRSRQTQSRRISKKTNESQARNNGHRVLSSKVRRISRKSSLGRNGLKLLRNSHHRRSNNASRPWLRKKVLKW